MARALPKAEVGVVTPLRIGLPDLGAILSALPDAVVVLDADAVLRYVNPAAENFFELGASMMLGRRLAEFLPEDNPVFGTIQQARQYGASVSEEEITIDAPRIGSHLVSVRAAAMVEGEIDGLVVVTIQQRSIARKIGRQLVHRKAARSVSAMAAMLAHEVKNPLSGIRGAAQLLEQTAQSADRELTRLICDEADRIRALVDRMEIFNDGLPIEMGPVNIHRVLGHVRMLAQSGFGRNVRFTENYDPSLPAVLGDNDQLIQIFLNLVKNAVEAVPRSGGEIVLSTAFQQGVRFAVPGSGQRVSLPLVVSVQDNGEGIPEDVRPHLFEPFITTKKKGTGLGLALVAKIVGDHGGVIEFDSQPRRTVFRVRLPVTSGEQGLDAGTEG
ncbi:MAG: PAS domain-containing protein [Rhodospirillales bacterium]|nr:PAS domain-containing protein [Rhodospirillales bacterium]